MTLVKPNRSKFMDLKSMMDEVRSGDCNSIVGHHFAWQSIAMKLELWGHKVGSFTRSERMAKWNECLRIQDELGAGAFVGGAPLAKTWWGKHNSGERT